MTAQAVRPGPPPLGMRVTLAESVVRCADGQVLFDTASGVQIRLRPKAVQILGDNRDLVVSDPAGARLARLLLDRGLADPVWGDETGAAPTDVTVVIPVRDRAEQVRRLVATLPPQVPVVIVDDGSLDPQSLTNLGRTVVRHETSRGPAAARNTGLAHVATDYVCFLDSDVTVEEGTLTRLRREFLDPAVAIAGPRILGLPLGPEAGRIARYEAARSSLDLGKRAGRVAPATRVSYLPSAALMARVAALDSGFDEDMQVAEDVDLVWRVVAAGWTVRYVPQSTVRHDHRVGAAAWLERKAFYGSGAEPLTRRHGDLVAPLRLDPLCAVAVAALASQRRWSVPIAAVAAGSHLALMASRTGPPQQRLPTGSTLTAMTLVATGWQLTSAITRHHWPVAALAALTSRRARRVVAVAAVAEGIADYRRVRPELDPATYLLLHRADDLAYGLGVWAGAVRGRSIRPLLPAWTRPWRRGTAQPTHDPAQGEN
ncbi:mycofactocin biosynthesis glycosyltransferase MftF [Branchiibius sp. NY16-3462-2]|uniref:mycofactocin biosynthesis glycosyltransferase MftF n=1 Tax=Branchiibius sp. NY16-3462-2 TaxID=1807500 RepID=UPI0025BB0506|nr:mycofactocin biosynthesis glycosyltransferase MftF [Branchiibius sp. NY16-3462-2]